MTRPNKKIAALGAVLALSLSLFGACSSAPADKGSDNAAARGGLDTDAKQKPIVPEKVDEIAAKVPAAVREKGVLSIGGAMGQNQYPPISFTADDGKTVVGFSPDVQQLIGGVLGLKIKMTNDSFEGAYLGLDSGKYDAIIGGMTVTDERLEKYDMATIRTDLPGFEVSSKSDLEIDGPEDISGKKVAVNPATLQAPLLKKWSDQLVAEGKDPVDIKSYSSSASASLALQSGQIDAYFTIGTVADYRETLPDATTKVAGYYPADDALEGTVSLKGNGLGEVFCEAINHVMKTGGYDKVLARWKMERYAIDQCELNPDTQF